MIQARHQLRIGDRVGVWGPTICFLLALIAVALLARDAMGQQIQSAESFDLIGTVVDGDNGQPLAGAFVSLKGARWGSVTNEKGEFEIPDVFPGPLTLSSEQLGYAPLDLDVDVRSDQSPLVLRMVPQPVMLEGLRVMTDRFEARRNRSTTSVLAYDREDLAVSPQESALEFVALHVGGARERCRGLTAGDTCLRLRGRTVEPVVYVDESPVLGGLDFLASVQPQELYLIEIFGAGRHIRAYTNHYMERAAKTRLHPIALLF